MKKKGAFVSLTKFVVSCAAKTLKRTIAARMRSPIKTSLGLILKHVGKLGFIYISVIPVRPKFRYSWDWEIDFSLTKSK